MKAYKIIVVVLVFLSFGFTFSTKTKVKITSKSEITIHGKSNVNSFKCKYNSNFLEDEILVTVLKNNETKMSFANAKISIKSKGFDCSSKMITKDFKTILKAEDYDNINIELKELDLNGTAIMTRLQIEIAGKTKEYLIPMAFNAKNNNVKGTLKLNIKDFDLKCPKKVFGLIEVDDNVDIIFNLFLQY